MSTRVTIEALTLGDRGQRYRVWHAGAVIVESSSAPEFDACRALLGLGVSGRLEVWRYGTSFASMRLDIENGVSAAPRPRSGR